MTYSYEELDKLAVDIAYAYLKMGMPYQPIPMQVDEVTLRLLSQVPGIAVGPSPEVGEEIGVHLVKLLNGITIKLYIDNGSSSRG